MPYPYQLPELPYPYDSLQKAIDEQTMILHHTKHHAGYVAGLNKALEEWEEGQNKTLLELLQNLSSVPESIREKVRNMGGGHYNHSFFWQILSPNPKPEPEGKLRELLLDTFSSLGEFREEFKEKGLKLFGSGWVWLVWKEGELKILTTPNQDSPVMSGHIPLLGLDLWEHAYYLRYQNRRGEYIENWWQILDWKKVEEIFERAHEKGEAFNIS